METALRYILLKIWSSEHWARTSQALYVETFYSILFYCHRSINLSVGPKMKSHQGMLNNLWELCLNFDSWHINLTMLHWSCFSLYIKPSHCRLSTVWSNRMDVNADLAEQSAVYILIYKTLKYEIYENL